MAPSHNHTHDHAPADYNRAFAIGVALNVIYIVVEATYGFLAGSLALLADAGHNLSDVLGLPATGLGGKLSGPAQTDATPHLRMAQIYYSGGTHQRYHPAGCHGRNCLGSGATV